MLHKIQIFCWSFSSWVCWYSITSWLPVFVMFSFSLNSTKFVKRTLLTDIKVKSSFIYYLNWIRFDVRTKWDLETRKSRAEKFRAPVNDFISRNYGNMHFSRLQFKIAAEELFKLSLHNIYKVEKLNKKDFFPRRLLLLWRTVILWWCWVNSIYSWIHQVWRTVTWRRKM
jgi:hypothetical protein